jgi:hypothetical protein
MADETTPTWGYKDDGRAQIFELRKREKLPAGWHEKPKAANHPNNPDFGKLKPAYEVEEKISSDGHVETITVHPPEQHFTVTEPEAEPEAKPVKAKKEKPARKHK